MQSTCEGCDLDDVEVRAITLTIPWGDWAPGDTPDLCIDCMTSLLSTMRESVPFGCTICGNDLYGQRALCTECGSCKNCGAQGNIVECDECFDHSECSRENNCGEQHTDCYGCARCLVPDYESGDSRVNIIRALCRDCAADAAATHEATQPATEAVARSEDDQIEYADGMTVVFRN